MFVAQEAAESYCVAHGDPLAKNCAWDNPENKSETNHINILCVASWSEAIAIGWRPSLLGLSPLLWVRGHRSKLEAIATYIYIYRGLIAELHVRGKKFHDGSTSAARNRFLL